MRRIVHTGALIVVLLSIAGCAAASGGSSAVAPSSGAAGIVAARCTRCHSLDRIKAARHDAGAWKVTVDRMRGKGAQLTESEEQQVVDFLAGGGAAGL